MDFPVVQFDEEFRHEIRRSCELCASFGYKLVRSTTPGVSFAVDNGREKVVGVSLWVGDKDRVRSVAATVYHELGHVVLGIGYARKDDSEEELYRYLLTEWALNTRLSRAFPESELQSCVPHHALERAVLVLRNGQPQKGASEIPFFAELLPALARASKAPGADWASAVDCAERFAQEMMSSAAAAPVCTVLRAVAEARDERLGCAIDDGARLLVRLSASADAVSCGRRFVGHNTNGDRSVATLLLEIRNNRALRESAQYGALSALATRDEMYLLAMLKELSGELVYERARALLWCAVARDGCAWIALVCAEAGKERAA